MRFLRNSTCHWI